jgi:hypothetical protein
MAHHVVDPCDGSGLMASPDAGYVHRMQPLEAWVDIAELPRRTL